MKYEWNAADSWKGLSPIVQVHGVCFDQEGRILIIREPGKGWHLVGGKPEAGEDFSTTLRREVMEETNIEIGDCGMIGYQKVARDDGSVDYQLRFAAIVERIGSERPDPTTGKMNERDFVSPDEISKRISYPEIVPIVSAAEAWRGQR